MEGWDDALRQWRQYQRATGVPDTTLDLRMHHLRRVARSLGGAPASVSLDDLVAFFARQSWSPNTRRSYRTSLRSFYSWMRATGRITGESPAHLLPAVRIPRAKPRPTPEHAYRRALRIAGDRERLAILLAAQCGLRRSEVAAARTDHLEPDLVGYSLRVEGKGGHVRMVPLPDGLVAEIQRREPGWLFPSSHGGHLTPHHLAKLVAECLPDGLTMHTLRHRAASAAYAGTRDLRSVQELLGHASPVTTQMYVQVPDDGVRAAMDAAAA